MTQDIESGDSKGLLFALFFSKKIDQRVLDKYHHQSLDSKPTQSPPSSPLAGDSSWPLFSIYSEIAEKEDDKLTERYQKVADGVLIFVSPRVNVRLGCPSQLEHSPVYSQPPSLRRLV